MLYYIIGAIGILFIMIYLISYFIKKAMIEKAKILFGISSLSDLNIETFKLRKMGINHAKMRTRYGSIITLEALSNELLTKASKDILKISNIFNWKKNFIFGNDFVYRKYRAIMGTVEVNRIGEQIYALQEKQAKIQINQVMQGYGLHDSKRNKVLAGLIPVEYPEDEPKENFGKEPNLHSRGVWNDYEEKDKMDAQKDGGCMCEADKEQILSVLDIDGEILNKLAGKTGQTQEENLEDIKRVEEETNVNETLKEKGIEIED